MMYVDDEEALVRLARRMLVRLGYRVTACASGREALEQLEASPQAFDLLMTDQVMPGIPGTELIRLARAVRPDLPIILCSGYSDIPAAQGPGGCTILTKPLTVAEVGRVLHAVLTRTDG